MISTDPPMSPYLRRWMLFVDGENLTLRAQALATKNKVTIKPSRQYIPDVFIWPKRDPRVPLAGDWACQPRAVRAYYYTSMGGDEDKLRGIRAHIKDVGFEPVVFKKESRTRKTKGVDISLTTDMLSHAYQNNYDTAILVAGDGDYTPLIAAVKRLGKNVNVAFFSQDNGLSDAVFFGCDQFFKLEAVFLRELGIPS